MHAVVRELSCDTFDLKTFFPENPRCFTLTLFLRIGPDDSQAADNFYVYICTPEWLKEKLWEPCWGRHFIILPEYNLAEIEKFIHDYVAQCQGDSWSAIAETLARVFDWEFEDYYQPE